MARARILVAVATLLAGIWGPQQPPGPAIPIRAANAWPGP